MTPPREPPRPSELARWFGPVLHRWFSLGVIVGACVCGGFALYSSQPGTYESATRLLVSKRVATMADRRGTGEDSATTMIQIATSDEVLGHAGRLLRTRQESSPLAMQLPAPDLECVDHLKLSLYATSGRESGPFGGSSVLTMKFVAGHPEDAKLVLEAILESVQWYLNARVSAGRQDQLSELDRAAAALVANRTALNNAWTRRKADLATMTTEDLTAVRARVSQHRQMAFTLQLEQTSFERELKAIADAGKEPAARQAVLRQLLGVTRLPAEGSDGEDTLAELIARRADLANRLVPGHPKLANLDAQIQFFKGLAGRAGKEPAADDELARYEGVVKARRRAVVEQTEVVRSQIAREEAILRPAIAVQDEVDLLRRQLDETAMELNRLVDRKAALTASQASEYELRELDRPRAGRQVGPRLGRFLPPAFLAGLALAFLTAHLREYLVLGFRNEDEVRDCLGLNVLGHIPVLPGGQAEDPSLIHATMVALRPNSIHAEYYRGVRASVLTAVQDTGQKVFVVTSPNPGDGKSTTAANLAASLARTGKRVVLVDCDFRKPDACRLFGLPPSTTGLSCILHGLVTLEEVLVQTGAPNLWLLPAGAHDAAGSADLLSGAMFAAIVGVLKKQFDFVIIDSPPLSLVSDGLVLARRADAVIMVFRVSHRCRAAVERANGQLATAGAQLLGVVVNAVELGKRGVGYAVKAYKRQSADARRDIATTQFPL